MTFLELKKRMARRSGKNSTTLDPYTDQRFMDFLNEAHAAVLRGTGRESLRYATVPFQSVPGKRHYALPTDATRINRITDRINDRRLEYHTPDWLDTVAPDPVTISGTPWAWIRRGYAYVHTQPSQRSDIYVAAYTGGDIFQKATIEGISDGGRYFGQTVTLNALTPVKFQWPMINISRFFLSEKSTGNTPIILSEDAAQLQQLAIIDPPRTRQQYQLFQLYPTPTAAQDYYMDLLMRVPDVITESEEPNLPLDFHEILIPMALLREMTKSDDPDRWQQVRLEADQGLRALDTFLVDHPDWNPQWGGPEDQNSRLGPWFPAGS